VSPVHGIAAAQLPSMAQACALVGVAHRRSPVAGSHSVHASLTHFDVDPEQDSVVWKTPSSSQV
jgi:hypothetical protein